MKRTLTVLILTNELKKNSYGHFVTALKDFKTQRELHHCLAALKVFNAEKMTPLLSDDS